VRRSYELWNALERETGVELLRITGGLSIGSADSELVRGVLESGRLHGIPLEVRCRSLVLAAGAWLLSVGSPARRSVVDARQPLRPAVQPSQLA
jgi:hypothetical protein